MGQRYRIRADQKPWSGLPKLKSEKSKLRDVLSKLVQLKHIAAEKNQRYANVTVRLKYGP